MKESGQTIVEYLIMVTVVLALVAIMNSGLRRSISTAWMTMSCEVAAPCPTCQGVDPQLKAGANSAAPGSCRQ